ncbi:MAG: carbohydrate ABC transporter permease [Lachnospiraceae bacterium]|nr:carbohydrate ABC transporter permease [Lachnospiraceae bacterium]
MSREELIFHLIAYPVFALVLLVCAYPFWYLFICTISDNKMVDLGQIFLLPKGIHYGNYIKVLKIDNLSNAAVVSVLRVIVGTGLQILVSSYAAYFFTKQEMWHRKLWYRLVVATMYFSAGMIPVYLNIKMLGMLNTFWVYVIPGMVGVYNMILIKTSIEALPADLEESAYLDGAGYLTRFFRIVLPLQKPILATVGLFGAVNHWNDFFTTKLYVTRPKLYTLQFLLYELLNQVRAIMEQPQDSGPGYDSLTPMATRMTMTAIVVVPIMLVYPFIQKYYVKGIMIGAVKG